MAKIVVCVKPAGSGATRLLSPLAISVLPLPHMLAIMKFAAGDSTAASPCAS